MNRNLFLTGAPSSGKTTVVRRVIEGLQYPAKGFYTQEIRREGRRRGFLLKSLGGDEGYLAHEDIASPLRLRRYGISLENLERITLPALEPEPGFLIILDEIGKMECLSERFRKAAVRALDADNPVIGTITLGGDPFIQGLKKRRDMELIEVTQDNRDALPALLLGRIREWFEP